MITPKDTLTKALALQDKRGEVYGPINENMARAAAIATLWLKREVSARDVAIILSSVKMARTATTPTHEDSYVDLANYVSFAAGLSAAPPVPTRHQPTSLSVPGPVNGLKSAMAAVDKVENDLADAVKAELDRA